MLLSALNPKTLASVVLVSAVAALGCSTSKSTTPATSPAASGTTTLSTQFTTTCAISGCHGSDGASVPSGSAKAALKGNTTYGSAAWKTTVRSGDTGTSMTAYSTTTYTDANMQADYKILTGLTF